MHTAAQTAHNPTLIWGAYLTRISGALAVVPTLADVPDCATCGGALFVATDDPDIRGACPACAGSGRAWSWRIQPTAGMLFCHDNGTWEVAQNDNLSVRVNNAGLCAICGEPVSKHFTPLAPPPGCGCTLAEALALLPGYIAHPTPEGILVCELPLGAGLRAVFIGESDAEPLLYTDPHYSAGEALDPDAVILAAGNMKALQAYIAGWEGM